MMTKEREIEVLKYKIAGLEAKIDNFEKYNISDRKIKNLQLFKLKYEDMLAGLELE